MPSANGVYTLPTGYLAVTGATIQASQHNPPLEDIAAALTLRLSRDGTAAMTGPIQLAVGTAGAPGAVFSTDPTTGLFKSANGVGVSVAGVQIGEFTSGGLTTGVRMLGELLPWVLTSCPALFVFPVGQTLLRASYPALWTQAQIEITAGSTFFNNGNGTTTFGIGDLRGRGIFFKDTMGGSAASRLTTAASGVDGTTLGAVGGSQTYTLLRTDLPNVAPTFTGNSQTVNSNQSNIHQGGNTIAGFGASGQVGLENITESIISVTFTPTGSVQSLNGGVTQTLTNNMPPGMVIQCIMFAGA